MLVLTRKLQEQIVIGDNIKVTILRVKGNTVRLGIEAPRHVRVVRSELPPETNYSVQGDVLTTPVPAATSPEDMHEANSGVPRCPPPLAQYLVGLMSHAS